MPRTPPLALGALAVSLALAAPLHAQAPPTMPPTTPPTTPPTGCYRADRPLGTVGPQRPRVGTLADASVLAFDDSTAHYYRLDSAGRIARPMLTRGARWWDRGRWTLTGDTLQLRLASGTVGWQLELIGDHATGRYAGMATYTSDAIVRGAIPPRVAVRVRPAPCPPDAPR
jgi:hypothetical protein